MIYHIHNCCVEGWGHAVGLQWSEDRKKNADGTWHVMGLLTPIPKNGDILTRRADDTLYIQMFTNVEVKEDRNPRDFFTAHVIDIGTYEIDSITRVPNDKEIFTFVQSSKDLYKSMFDYMETLEKL